MKFGDKFNRDGKRYMVTEVGARVVQTRRVFDNPEFPNGQVGHGIIKFKLKDLKGFR